MRPSADGGPGSEYNSCPMADCTDCGPRPFRSPPPPRAPPPRPRAPQPALPPGMFVRCTNTCVDSGGGSCSDGGPGAEFTSCAVGDDCIDCGPRLLYYSPPPSQSPPPPSAPFNLPPSFPLACSNNCTFASDGDCDGTVSGAATSIPRQLPAAAAAAAAAALLCRMAGVRPSIILTGVPRSSRRSCSSERRWRSGIRVQRVPL